VDFATLGALCALGSAVAWALTSLLVRSLTPRFGTLASSTAPLFAVPLGVVFLGERLPPIALVGAGVAVVGVVVLKL